MGCVKYDGLVYNNIDTVVYRDSFLYFEDNNGHFFSGVLSKSLLNCKGIMAKTVSCSNAGAYLKGCNVGELVSSTLCFSSDNQCGSSYTRSIKSVSKYQFNVARDIATYKQSAAEPTHPMVITLEGDFQTVSVAMSEISKQPYIVQLDGADIDEVKSMLVFCESSKVQTVYAGMLYA